MSDTRELTSKEKFEWGCTIVGRYYGFYRPILSALSKVQVIKDSWKSNPQFSNSDMEVFTLCVSNHNGGTLFYGEDFLKDKPFPSICFYIVHEISHIILGHLKIGRYGKRNHFLLNLAQDYVINYMIQKYAEDSTVKFGQKDVPLSNLISMSDQDKADSCYDEKYFGWTAEEVYEDLIETATKGDKTKRKLLEGRSSELTEKELEEILENLGLDKDLKDKIGSHQPMDSDSPLTKSMEMTLRSALRGILKDPKDLKELSKLYGESAGDEVLELREWVGLDQYVNWEEQLRDKVTSTALDATLTYSKFNRRSRRGVIKKGKRKNPKLNVAIALDTSGSMTWGDSNELPPMEIAVNEVINILRMGAAQFTATVISVDTQASLSGFLDSDQGDLPEDITEFAYIGGGGTDMNPAITWLNSNFQDLDAQPELLIILTDGYVPEINVECETSVLVGAVTEEGYSTLKTIHPKIKCFPHLLN